MARSYEINRDDPGYQRSCLVATCAQSFNALDIMEGDGGTQRGWHYGPRMFGGYLCPVHGPVATEHLPRWVRVDDDGQEVITGCECQCGGWMWLPGIHQTMGAFSERWAQHIGVTAARAAGAVCR